MAWGRRGLLVAGIALAVAAGTLAGCLGDQPAEPASSDEPDPADPQPSAQNASSPNGTSDEETTAASNSSPPTNRTPTVNTTEAPGPVSSFRTYGCETTFAMIEVPKPWAARRTPEGIEPASFFPPSAFVPGAPNRTVTAAFLVASNHCETVVFGDGGEDLRSAQDVDELYYGVFVDPPSTYRSEAVKMYVYPFAWVVDGDDALAELEDWGLPFRPGSVDLSTRAQDGSGRAWTVTAESNASSVRLALTTSGATPAGDESTVFRVLGTPTNGTIDQAMDYAVEVQNSTQNPLGQRPAAAAFAARSPDLPTPAASPTPISVTRWTPSDEVSQRATLVDLDPSAAGSS